MPVFFNIGFSFDHCPLRQNLQQITEEIELKHDQSNKETSIPLPDNKILDWSKLEQIADDILKCI